jgi:two-component system sensor histidine kinase PilS (NtrC family)
MAGTSGIAEAQYRDLYFYSLYRVLEAGLLALLLFGPVRELLPAPAHPLLGKVTSVAYLLASAGLMYWGLRQAALRWQVVTGIAIDVFAGLLAIHAMPAAASGIALMLVFNVGATALLLPLRYGLAGGALAGVAMIGEYIWSSFGAADFERPLAEPLMFAVSFLSIAMLTYLLGRQIRESQALAARRGGEVADLAAINELIIRRMRTGVLLVDGDGRIRLANEAAMLLFGDRGAEQRLAEVAPALAERLHAWLRAGTSDDTPLRIGDEQPEVLPRFARLLAHGDTALVFLDDTSLVSRRAESMTLATLGRFSASLAHEIRNPLAAINYATQLLQESGDIGEADQRLLQIIHAQCQRTNGIVENVLGLARRERANADNVDLAAFVRRFVDDYIQVLPAGTASIEVTGSGEAHALVDPSHLQQVLTVLVQNALQHGHLPGDPAHVTLELGTTAGRPTIDVRDRGPGIGKEARDDLFRPFFTTSELGTGLGLYIARELCRANEASLDYVDMPDKGGPGGGCFRVTLPDPHSLLPA